MRNLTGYITALLGLSIALSSASPIATEKTRRDASSQGFNPFPLDNGFPNPDSKETDQIQQQALGILPNGPVPDNISGEGLFNLQIIALNEIFEVAFFTQLLYNVTNNVRGYEVEQADKREFIIKTLTAVQAQEELHALNANGALQHFGHAPIQPCKYKFPVNDLDSAIKLANTFTSVVLGTLQDVVEVFAQMGDTALTRSIASVIGQEGEQEGWYRVFQGKVPSELPFLTTATRDLAFNALNQSFFVPGSCPNIDTIPAKTFEPLTLLTSSVDSNTTSLQFSFVLTRETSEDNLKLVYINQQNVPIVEDFDAVKVEGDTVTIQAAFPYAQDEMNGLTIAVLAYGDQDSLNDANAVSDHTKFGPALIIVN